MNNKIYSISICLLLLLAACNNQPNQSSSRPDSAQAIVSAPQMVNDDTAVISADLKVIDESNFALSANNDKYRFIQKLLDDQKACFATDNEMCKADNDSYCQSDSCLAKILKCHEISKDQFNDLIKDMGGIHAEFSIKKIHRIIDKAVCGHQRIRFSHSGNTYYLKRVNDMAGVPAENQAFYSVALLNTIVNPKGGTSDVTSIDIYDGVVIEELNFKILPFIVNFSHANPRYYDVSDTEP